MQGKGRFYPMVGWVLGAAAVVLVVAILLVATSGVRLADAWPANGDAAPITAPLRLAFSQAMDPASVQAHLRIEPAIEGRVAGEGREFQFRPRVAWAPDTTYTVTLEAGMASAQGRPLAQEQTWAFRTRAPGLVYLGRTEPEGEVRQVFLLDREGVAPRALTEHPTGVWDVAAHPQGEALVYSVLRADGGADLWWMDRQGGGQKVLLACPGEACLNPAWSPDGGQIAYERRGIWAGAPNLEANASRIGVYDLGSGEDRELFDYDVAAHSPLWSPDGSQLAYLSPLLHGIEVYDLNTQELQQFGNDWGAAPTWSPDGRSLAVAELMLAGEALVVRLVRIDLEQEAMVDISGDEDMVKDVAPAWSPGGGWIAFGRQFLDAERWTPGRQVWLTRPDASEAYGLPSEPGLDRFGFVWRPDGGALAYLASDLSDGLQAAPRVSVWVFDFAAGQAVRVAEEGVLPRWLP